MIGENPVTAANLHIFGSFTPTSTPPMNKLFRHICSRARNHILQVTGRQKHYTDSKRRAVEYNFGNQVWLSSKHLPALNHCSEFEARYRGPFTVSERNGRVAYRLALPPTYEGHNVFHVPQLVPDHPRAGAQLPPEALVGWPPTRDEARKPTDQFLRITYSISRGLETKHVTLLSGKAPPRSGLGGRGCKGPLYVPSKLFRTGQYL
ncbi:hypothetical protein EMWEY_00051960 [Eimeria maxima]|uniref:Tf2-1-like SH3-like domain-containing protein n=1 Tax=Eimeria maxima TaxID=5804 RepID=U6M812_EIMMA|nr:hypothetical protein EMWEY_00051960 [Eimeria maxima]CDJ58584.1 hypothetical protein EMWEY_00051960 [Eimeria maxima]